MSVVYTEKGHSFTGSKGCALIRGNFPNVLFGVCAYSPRPLNVTSLVTPLNSRTKLRKLARVLPSYTPKQSDLPQCIINLIG